MEAQNEFQLLPEEIPSTANVCQLEQIHEIAGGEDNSSSMASSSNNTAKKPKPGCSKASHISKDQAVYEAAVGSDSQALEGVFEAMLVELPSDLISSTDINTKYLKSHKPAESSNKYSGDKTKAPLIKVIGPNQTAEKLQVQPLVQKRFE